MPFFVATEDSMKVWEARKDEIATHFQSDLLAEKYMDGLIDWDGNPVEEF